MFAVDLKTGNILRFETQSEAARQLGVNAGSINMVIKGKRNKAGWYWFTCADENAIEKVKANLGDDIAIVFSCIYSVESEIFNSVEKRKQS